MSQKFEDKSAKIIAVDPSSTSRQLLTDVLKGMGFTDITGVANAKDLVGVIEVEPVDWIITPFDKEEPVNAFHILRLITKHQELKNARLSIMYDENEKEMIGTAYALGLLSHHPLPYTKDSLTTEFEKLFELLSSNSWDSCLTSASMLGEYLKESERFDEWALLRKNLIDAYPGDSKVILGLAEPLFRKGDKDEAIRILKQVKLMDDELETEIDRLNQEHGGGADLNAAGNGGDEAVNVLALDRCVVVDADTAIHTSVTETLNEIGVKDVQCFEDGEAAISYLKESSNPGLIIQEWRIPKVTGPLFLQNMRQNGTTESPVVIQSSLLAKEDMPLIREMGVADLIEKPFDKKQFLKKIIWTVRQDKLPTDQYTMERKLRESLATGKIAAATELKSKYLNDEQIPTGRKKLIEAEFAYATMAYESAKEFGYEALKHGGEGILILNLLGKTLMKLEDFPAALKCFERAQLLSPLNIERLCRIAEVQQEMGDTDKANETLDKAKEIDENNEKVTETEAKVALSSDNIDKARELMNQLESLSDLIAYMNNKAVAMARSGNIDDGVNEYQKTLKALPEDKADLRAIVYYNLGLAYARNGDLEEGKTALQSAIDIPDASIKKKAQSLQRRIKRALDKGEELVLKTKQDATQDKKEEKPEENGKPATPSVEEPQDNTINEINEEVVAAVQTKKGDIACFMVFHETTTPEAAKALMTALPKFTVRIAISRDESMGADKLMATG